MLIFIKQVKWRNGIVILLKSAAMKIQFKRLAFEAQSHFVRETLMLAYRIEEIPNPEYDDSDAEN